MTENKTPSPVLIASPPGPRSSQLTPEQLLELYYFLQLNRQLETRLERLFRQNKISGGLYSSLGQEAVSVGAAYALEPRDWLAPMIRNIGGLLVKGFPPRDIFAQHMGRYNSPTRGKDSTSHFADLKVRHTVAPSSMLGNLISVMTGVSMAARYLGHQSVALTWIGDGGSSTGAFHEGLNFAAVQRAPLVVILENNQWAYSTPVSHQAPLRDFAQRAASYGIRSSIADGNDVIAVYRATKEAVAECRAGRGPFLIEMKTMRMKGHAQHDGATYVPPEMLEHWKKLDPIERFETYLTEKGLLDPEQKTAILGRVERELDADQKFAEESPMPPPESAAEGVFCDGCHTIAAEWQRPQSEVTPPATVTQAKWKIANFGSLPRPAESGEAPAPARVAKPQASQGRQSPQAPQAAKPEPVKTEPAKPAPAGTEAAKTEPPAEVPVRVPFGRGPKDRAFILEQQPVRQPNRPPQRGQQNRPPQRGDHNRPQQSGQGGRPPRPNNSQKRNSPPRGKRKP